MTSPRGGSRDLTGNGEVSSNNFRISSLQLNKRIDDEGELPRYENVVPGCRIPNRAEFPVASTVEMEEASVLPDVKLDIPPEAYSINYYRDPWYYSFAWFLIVDSCLVGSYLIWVTSQSFSYRGGSLYGTFFYVVGGFLPTFLLFVTSYCITFLTIVHPKEKILRRVESWRGGRCRRICQILIDCLHLPVLAGLSLLFMYWQRALGL